MRSQVSNLGHSVDFVLVINIGTTERRNIWGWRWREIILVLEVLNLKCLSDIQVKMTIGKWRFKYFSRAPNPHFDPPTVVSGEVFNSGSQDYEVD